ncbi:hypothetical protein OF375_02870 [Ureaplasma miroungigenitalium]|uniref:hypothetical protein n=1 Tax=Ureaplasma miroungigenitalium TaxID=1042321 RepID=UPI0021E87998|nr:hypothetical protein [Ureaplasma miroungigenitalium]MCV3734507.1 hypothetical protein [Ureaplasma miroungigenitalium]
MKKKNLKALWFGLAPLLLIPIVAASCHNGNNKEQDKLSFNKKTAAVYKIDALLSQLMDERSLEGLTPEEKIAYQEEVEALNQRYLSVLNDMNNDKFNQQDVDNLKKDIDTKASKVIHQSSNQKYTKELEETLYSLRTEIANLKTANEAMQTQNDTLAAANKALIEKHTQEIEDMKQQLKEAVENAVDPDLIPIEKTKTSAKAFLKLLSDFLLNDFFVKLKKDYPETYKNDESLIAQIVQSFDITNKDIAKLTENKKNLPEFEKLTLFTIKRVALICQYVKPEDGSITLDNPKSEYFDTLFDWRINDLDRAITSITNKAPSTFKGANETEQTAKKQEIIKQLTALRDSYKTAKGQADSLQKQVTYFSILEDEDHFEAALSQDKHYFSPKYNAGDVQLSEFPILQEITDQKFLEQVYDEFKEIAIKLSNHLRQHGNEYIRSVKFHKLYENYKNNVNYIIRTLNDKPSLKYFNELVYKQDLDKFLRKMKDIYYEVTHIDTSKEKQEYENFVDFQLALNNPDNFYGFFKKNVIDKRNSLDQEDNQRIYIYQQFATNIDAELKTLRDKQPKTFIEAYDRLIAFLLIKSRVEMILQIVQLYSITGDDLNDEAFKNLTKYDLSAKFDKRIKASEQIIAEWEGEKEGIDTLVNGILLVPTDADLADEIKYRLFIEKVADNMKQVLETFATNFATDGIWKFVFDSPDTLTNLLKSLNEKIVALNSSKESKDLATLKAEFAKIKDEHHNIIVALNGDDNPSYYGALNKALKQAMASDEESAAAKELLAKVQTTLTNVKLSSEITTKENISSTLNEWKTSLQALKTELEQSTEYKKPFKICTYAENFTLKTMFLETIENLIAKIDALLPTVEQTELESLKTSLQSIINVAQESLAHFGNESDGQTEPLFKEHLELIENEKLNLEGFIRSKRKNAKLAVLIPGQELFVLLRSFQSQELAHLDQIMIPEKYQDKALLTSMRNPFVNLKKSKVVSGVWSLKGDDKNIDISDPDLVDNKTEADLYKELRLLEDEYAASILQLLKSTEEPKPADLDNFKKKREAYYNFLNDLQDNKKVYLANHYARFSADVYERPEPSENMKGYTAYDLVNDYATLIAINNMMKFLDEEFINPKK